jgi:hypothetical protein
MRERALESLRYLEKKYDVPSIAFENLGPPKLAKLRPGSKQGNKEALKNNENHTEFC